MGRVGRNYRDETRTGQQHVGADRNFELALDHVPDLFICMRMLMDPRSRLEHEVSECHVLAVEAAPLPTREAFGDFQITRVNKRHALPPVMLLDPIRDAFAVHFLRRITSIAAWPSRVSSTATVPNSPSRHTAGAVGLPGLTTRTFPR